MQIRDAICATEKGSQCFLSQAAKSGGRKKRVMGATRERKWNSGCNKKLREKEMMECAGSVSQLECEDEREGGRMPGIAYSAREQTRCLALKK